MAADLLVRALSTENWCSPAAARPVELLPLLASGSADLAIISAELDSRGQSGFDLATSVAHAYPELPIVLLLMQSTPNSVVSAFRSGARGVVSREQPISLFLNCIQQVRKGFLWAGGREAEVLLGVLRNLPTPSLFSEMPLTERELQIVRCAAAGKTNRSIASELALSEHTIKNYLFRIFEKIGVSSRIELLFYLTCRGQNVNLSEASSGMDSDGPVEA
jgi:DNA-binding NarL/FixJ family response regulator